MFRMVFIILCCVAVLAACAPVFAGEKGEKNADRENPETEETIPKEKNAAGKNDKSKISFSGYFQIWWNIKSEAENGQYQSMTFDRSDQETSGFFLRRARLEALWKQGHVGGKIGLRLERSLALLDAYANANLIDRYLQLWAGQMKVPSTYEVEKRATELDFATRSQFSGQVVNWSLARSPNLSSPFNGLITNHRDLGVGFKGKLEGFRYFLMTGNGLGANLFVSGDDNRQYISANDFGSYFYGARFSYDLANGSKKGDFLRKLELGGYFNNNRHTDVLFNDERTVLDIIRKSWSVDLQMNFMGRLRLVGLTGAGTVGDDFDHDNVKDYRYRGWEAKINYEIIRKKFEIGFRADSYWEEFSKSSIERRINYTYGLTYTPFNYFKLQLNYKEKRLLSKTELETDDDVFMLMLQFKF